MSVIPARTPPVEGESLLSVIRRTTQAMGYESTSHIFKLIRQAGAVPFWLNELQAGSVSERLADLLGMTVSDVMRHTIHRYSLSLVLNDGEGPAPQVCDNRTRLRYFDPQTRVCPQCLGDSSNPFEKLIWSFRPAPVCVDHGTLLLSRCSACSMPIPNARPRNAECRCGHRLDHLCVEQPDDELIRPIRMLLAALDTGQRMIPNVSLPAAFFWLERMTRAVDQCAAWKQQLRTTWNLGNAYTDETISWLAAASIVERWPDGLFEFLDAYVRQPKYCQTATGLGRRLGRLHHHASELEGLGHSGPADAMREYLSQRYSAGHINGKVCLFHGLGAPLLADQDWMPMTLAAAELTVSVAAVSRLVTDGVLNGEIHRAGHNGKSIGVVARASLDRLKRQLNSSITSTEAATRLGIHRHRVAELIRTDVLNGAVRVKGSWHIPMQSLDDVLRLISNLHPIRRLRPPYLSLREATRRFGKRGFTLAAAIKLISDGLLPAKRGGDGNALAAVIVKADDIEQCRAEIQRMRDDRKGIPLNRLAQTLLPGRPTKERVLKKWIKTGLLNADRSRREWSVAHAEVERFRSTYCLAAEACQILGRHRRTLGTWETDGHLTPVYGPRVTPGAGFTLYQRADVERLKITKPMRRQRPAQYRDKNQSNQHRKEDVCI